jgi:sugar O-acyltransferase (sialic acid O-acetyltransferase NeuD family)
MRLVIFGAGGMGRELADIALRKGLDIVFAVDPAYRDGPRVQDVKVIDPSEIEPSDRLIFALGSSAARRALAERFGAHEAATLIAPSAIVSPSAEIGEGSQIGDFAVVNNSARLGRHVQLNTFAQVSHDCVLEDFVTVAPNVSCNGWVHIEEGAFIGASAVIRNGEPGKPLRIGRGATVGMGAVVVGSVPAGATVVGNPARPR